MMFTGVPSWSMTIDDACSALECALWLRAAERIDIPADDEVTGPLDIAPPPEPSLPSGEPLREGWLVWWKALLALRQFREPVDSAVNAAAHPGRVTSPPFDGLAAYPLLQQTANARWNEATAWSAQRHPLPDHDLETPPPGTGREGEIVRAVEARLGRRAEPFDVRIFVLPVRDTRIRSLGRHTFLVPERVRDGAAYDEWLSGLVRALA